MITDLDTMLNDAVTKVFNTMLKCPVESCPAGDNGAHGPNGETHVAGAVGFAGSVTGVVYISTTAGFARQITSRLLGLAENEIEGDEMVNDTVGELANMVVGQVKSRLCDKGFTCVLTVPSVVRGSCFSVESVGSDVHHVLSFRSQDRQLRVEVILKNQKEPNA